MINVSGANEITVMNVKKSYFKLAIKLVVGDGSKHLWDINPDDYINGGKYSTGNIISDMIMFVNTKLSELTNSIKFNKVEFKEVVARNEDIKSKDDLVMVTDIEITNDFEKLHGICPELFWAAMFIGSKDLDVRGSIHSSKEVGSQFALNQACIYLDAEKLSNMLLRVFLYSYSQSFRDKLTARACVEIVDGDYGSGHNIHHDTSVYIYNHIICDYINVSTTNRFKAKQIYDLSYSNNCNASNTFEVLPRVDELNSIHLRYVREGNNDATVFSIEAPNLSGVKFMRTKENILCLNAYKVIKGDCMISCSIFVDYKDDKHKDLNENLTGLFYGLDIGPLGYLMCLYPYNHSDFVKYENIVYDMDLESILNNPLVRMSYTYSTYSSSNGARKYEYDALKTRKITPVSRRNALYEVSCELMQFAGLDIIKTFSKLDVDFKRFYGHAVR